MPTATNNNTTPTRRSATGFSVATFTAGLAVAAVAEERREPEDPILALYGRYRTLQDAHAVLEGRTGSLHAGLIERWGEADKVRGARATWGHDPAYAEMKRSSDESDDLNAEICRVVDQIVETQAGTAAGICLKMQVGVDIWPSSGDADYHEIAARAFMRDARRVLGGGPAA